MSHIETKLAEMGLELPVQPKSGGNYLPYRIHGNMLTLAGVVCVRDGSVTHAGQVGAEQTIESGYEAAKVCALNALAAIKGALGDLDRVDKFLYMGGYVNAVANFGNSPQVINGASDLFVALFGEAGMHARAAIAVAGLPMKATVEIQVNITFK